MIRRIIALFSFLSLMAMFVFADNQEIEINLSPSNGYQDTAQLSNMGMIYVCATPDSNNEKASISIQVQNLTGDRGLLMFNRNHAEEKETKKGDFKKNYFEIAWPDVLKTTGIRGTDGLQPDVFFIAQGHTKELPLLIPEFGNETKSLNLCFYPCLVEKKNKDGLPQKVRISAEEKFSIKLNVELGPDTEFEELKARCEAFVKEIKNKKICSCEGCKNLKPHHPGIEGQFEELSSKVSEKIGEIREIAKDHGIIMIDDIKNSKYQQLIDELKLALEAKQQDIASGSCLEMCKKCKKPKTCNLCGGPVHGKGMCESHPKNPIGCPKGCKVNHPKQNILTWREANDQLDKVYQALKGKKPISCKEAQRKAKNIKKRAEKSRDDGYKESAMNKYNRIMQCK